MKHRIYKLLVGLTLLIIPKLTYAQSCTWTGAVDKNFNNVKNWEYEDFDSDYNLIKKFPTSISDTFSFTIPSGISTIKLSADCIIYQLTIIGSNTLNFDGHTLSLNYLKMESPSLFDTSTSGSKLIYTNYTVYLHLKGYSNFNLDNFFYPEKPIKSKTLYIENSTINLTQATTLRNLQFISTSSTKGYLNLNGHSLVLSDFYIHNDNTAYIIPHANSDLTFNNLNQNTSNIRFASSSKTAITSGIELNSIQKIGTGTKIAKILGDISLSEKISCNSGSITITGSVTLLSDSSKTAYVGESAGTITATGGFTVQQYIPGRRVFRFLAHPFDASIALSQLTDDIDITGTGGSANGFTNTPKSNPSAFYFDPSAADNTASGLNPGWISFANTSSTSWNKATPALIYIRGAKAEGINGNAYTPSAVTLDMNGTINKGPQPITLNKGTNSDFITVGNPYPSPIQMQSIASSQRSNIGSAFWVFDSNLGTNGGYVSKLWDSDSYVLPAYAGFATTLSANGSINFEEADKTTATPAGIFLEGSNLSDLVLNVFVNDRLYDLTRLITKDQAMSDKDYFDGGKMENADINLFSLSKNGEKLSIDARPFDLNTERIAMGLFSSENRNIKIQADPSAFLNEHSVTLIDHYTHKQYNLNEGASAELRIDLNQSKSYGTERLELVIGQLQSHTEKLSQAQVHVYPNPSQSSKAVNIQANSPIRRIAVMDISGRLVWEISPENNSEFVEIPETALANAGIYFIEITTPLGSISQKHLVQF